MKKHGFTHYLKVFLLSFAFMIVLAVFSYTRKNAETGEYLYLVSSSINVQGFWANEFVLFGRTFKIGLLLIDLAAAIIFPLALTGIFLLLDIGRGKAGKKSKEELNKERYEEFVDGIGHKLNQTHLFNVEDFRHFRENSKFQECLKKLYQIYSEGETEENTYFLVLRKFDKGTKERDAIEYLITYTGQKRQEFLDKEKELQVQKEAKENKKDALDVAEEPIENKEAEEQEEKEEK